MATTMTRVHLLVAGSAPVCRLLDSTWTLSTHSYSTSAGLRDSICCDDYGYGVARMAVPRLRTLYHFAITIEQICCLDSCCGLPACAYPTLRIAPTCQCQLSLSGRPFRHHHQRLSPTPALSAPALAFPRAEATHATFREVKSGDEMCGTTSQLHTFPLHYFEQ